MKVAESLGICGSAVPLSDTNTKNRPPRSGCPTSVKI
ncbi:MAG: hypothetical protein JWO46_2810, partial [Nocardioidaceae bacterium]|nr:hypothetical protein [Nocardioidaceae bacterium]